MGHVVETVEARAQHVVPVASGDRRKCVVARDARVAHDPVVRAPLFDALLETLPGSLAVEWQTYPGGRENPEFLAELAAAVPKDQPVMFLCRSGARSNAAAEAATRAGWKEAYNILEGFEGDKDANQHRNTVGGWRKAGLPWTQS